MIKIDNCAHNFIRTNSRGATLVEVMGAVALFAISAVALMALTASSQTMGQRSDKAYNAYNLAKNHIEFLRTLSFGDLDAADETEVRLDRTGVPDPEGDFLRSTTVTTPYDGDEALAQVDVEVAYEVRGEVTGQPMQVSSVIRNEEA